MNDKFNDSVKNAFDQLEDDFNPDLIWEGINLKMKPKEKKKRRFLVWWVTGVGLGLILFSAVLYFYSSLELDSEEDNITYSEQSSSETNINDGMMPAEVINPNIAISETSSKTEINVLDLEVTKSMETYVSRPMAKSYSSIGRLNGDKQELEENKIYEKSNISTEEILTTIIKNKARFEERSILSNKTEDKKASSQIELNILSLEAIRLKELDFMFDFIMPDVNVKPQKYKDNRSNNIGYWGRLEMYTGVEKGSKNNLSSNAEYSKDRNNDERLLEQINFGSRIQVVNVYDFSLWAGVKYSRITDQWRMDLEYTEDLPFTYIVNTTEYPDGVIEEHFTTEVVGYDVKRFVEQYNSEHIISIPLEMRYGEQMNSWMVSIGIGFEMNYVFSAEHNVMGLDGLPFLDKKVGYWANPSMSTGLHTAYAIDPVWSITAGVNYRRLSINNSSIVNDLISKYNLLGFELGVSRNLKY